MKISKKRGWIILGFILLILFLYFFPYIRTYQVIDALQNDQWSIDSIIDGSGNVIEVDSSLEDSINNELKRLSYHPMIDILRKGGWSYKLVIQYYNEEHVIILSRAEWVKIDGIKFRINQDIDWERVLSKSTTK